MLMEAIVERARGHFGILRLRAGSAGAASLYERVGFVAHDADDETHRISLR